MYFNPTNPLEVKKLIVALKSVRSICIDEIPSIVVTRTPDNVIYFLTHIFNRSFAEGKFITAFKKAKVISVFTKECLSDVANYRPISLLPVMSKILEKLMYVQVISFLNQQNFCNNFQFGLRKNHSTSHACSLMLEEIVHAFEDKRYVLGIFLDLSKAFDTLGHQILLDKLHHYGIRGLAHTWFHNYLTERTQLVEIDHQLSASKSINFGVPQVSIFGLLLF